MNLEFKKWEISNQASGQQFRFQYIPTIPKKKYLIAHEVRKACELINHRRKNKTVALCYSGGMDSEIIARNLIDLEIPFELYFLNIWGINKASFKEWGNPFIKETKKAFHEIFLDRVYFYEDYCLRLFREFGCELPTYIALTYLFEQIPKDNFIVVGDGDLDRTGSLYQHIAAQTPFSNLNLNQLPFSASVVLFERWAKKNSREGEFTFFQSTPELIASVLMIQILK